MTTIQEASLFFQDGSSDKEYHLQLVETNGGYLVNFQYGRRGSTLKDGSKTSSPVPQNEAQKIYDKVLAEKLGKGYIHGASDSSYVSTNAATVAAREIIFIPQLLNPVEETEVERFLKDDSFGAQEKIDGEHQSVHKKIGKIFVTNKKGQSIGYPKALEAAIESAWDTLVDSEAIGETYHAFDLLEALGEDLRSLGYQDRYETLKGMFDKGLFGPSLVLVPLAIGYRAKKALFDRLKKEGREGIVFKKLTAPFSPGKAHDAMWKCKFYHELSARVVKGREGKRSVGLELLDGKKWVFMGNVTIPPNKEPPLPGTVLEVRYLYCYVGGHLFQTIYEKPRIDVDAEECTIAQVKYKAEEE
jgi:bifunctional non-homologous end joining protein LigD